MPVGRYVFLNPDTVRALEFTGANTEEVYAAFEEMRWWEGEGSPYFCDDNGNYVTVEPGQMVIEYHDGTVGVMPRGDFHAMYDLVEEEE